MSTCARCGTEFEGYLESEHYHWMLGWVERLTPDGITSNMAEQLVERPTCAPCFDSVNSENPFLRWLTTELIDGILTVAFAKVTYLLQQIPGDREQDIAVRRMTSSLLTSVAKWVRPDEDEEKKPTEPSEWIGLGILNFLKTEEDNDDG